MLLQIILHFEFIKLLFVFLSCLSIVLDFIFDGCKASLLCFGEVDAILIEGLANQGDNFLELA